MTYFNQTKYPHGRRNPYPWTSFPIYGGIGGYDDILVAVDRLTKMSHFIPCRKDINAKQFVIVFLKEIFRLYELPRDIITDRGSIFTSDMWKEITNKTKH